MKTFASALFSTTRSTPLVVAATLAAFGLAGCGGVGNTSSARLRAVDAATDAATADLLVNSSASFGDQTNFSISPRYFYIGTGSSKFQALTSVTSNNSGTVTSRLTNYTLNSGQFYSAYIVGVGSVTSSADPRQLEVVVADDTKPALSAGQAAVRVIDAAPDAGRLDVLVNGHTPDASFSGLTFPTAADNVFVGKYVPVTAGSLSVQANAAGTANAIVPAATVTVLAGKAYTLLVTEPTASPSPAYALQTTAE